MQTVVAKLYAVAECQVLGTTLRAVSCSRTPSKVGCGPEDFAHTVRVLERMLSRPTGAAHGRLFVAELRGLAGCLLECWAGRSGPESPP